ncbi:hypothetical protein NQ317_003901 [Molorchus minor]|uniref:Nuclease HARBI1 n=1 Tax=Molorchus minor TaxID=1323400 RepID=A0ABQ9J8T1_9CUCU|nr:hypothetical protein NQ317_003901 [Molorchus minor]
MLAHLELAVTIASFPMVRRSTMHRITNTMDFLLNLGPQITFPNTEEEKREVVTAFESISGFPNVIRCIDGSYIQIRTPAAKIKST